MMACGSEETEQGTVQAAAENVEESFIDAEACKTSMNDHHRDFIETIDREEICF